MLTAPEPDHSFIRIAGQTLLALLALQTLLQLVKRYIFKPKYPRIPGPWQIPYIGRVHDLPLQYTWLKFKEWADEFGPIYMTKMFGHNLLVLTDESIVEDLLVKRAKIYSDRPMMRSLVDSKSTYGSMEYLPLMGKNEYWARQRKWAHLAISQTAKLNYRGVMDYEVRRMLFLLTKQPDDAQMLLEDMASRIMCTLAWDEPSVSKKNTIDARDLLHQISPCGPITNLVTPLWHLPYWINPWKQAEKNIRHDPLHAWQSERFAKVQMAMENGTQRPCWAQRFLAESKHALSGEKEAANCVGMLALMGVLTVGGPLQYFLVSMVHHPEWFKKCQQEIDEVCQGRMPTLADSPNLPILRACIKETIRWRPNIPTGVGHELQEDDVYMGYFIPKGTRILPMEWGILRDPKRYPDPWNFHPERFLEPQWPSYKEPLTQFPTIKSMSPFGWGQRTCIGQGITEDENLLACGGIAWGFDIGFKYTAEGEKIDVPTDKSNSLLIIKPDKFEIDIRPRKGCEGRIIEEFERAEENNEKSKRECGRETVA
ncbi:cytochrome P450 [Venturia nashicola]|uniref:Cytochrome P450 n=1 Tax=Venturia nashicola TaxID=86259 RepID=A0A4Z1P7F5_9PEZI|nr:cytochrome P450 [Venturia nashicola]